MRRQWETEDLIDQWTLHAEETPTWHIVRCRISVSSAYNRSKSGEKSGQRTDRY